MMEKIFLEEVMVHDRRTVSEDLIIEMIENIEENIGGNLTKKRKRLLYTTLTELLQNINNYTEKSQNQENKLEISYTNEDKIAIESSNLLDRTNKNILNSKLKELISLTKAEIDQKYDEVLHNGIIAKDRRNGLGILLAAKNAQEIDYKFELITLNLFKFKLKLIF